MSNIFSDLFGAIAGQQKETPYNPVDYQGITGQSIGQAANANIAYNNQLGPAYAKLNRQIENIYDPQQGALREATTQSILSELGLGGQIPADVQQQVIQNALQGNAASGFGISSGGRGLVARDLGLTGMDILNQRIGRAASYTRSAPRPGELYNPQTAYTPSDYANLGINEANVNNERLASEFARKEGNKIAMFNTFGRVAGGVIGGVFGGAPGAMMGSQVGGSLIQNPYRSTLSSGGSQSQGIGVLSNLFGGGGGGIGGPSQGIGGAASAYGGGQGIGGMGGSLFA